MKYCTTSMASGRLIDYSINCSFIDYIMLNEISELCLNPKILGDAKLLSIAVFL